MEVGRSFEWGSRVEESHDNDKENGLNRLGGTRILPLFLMAGC